MPSAQDLPVALLAGGLATRLRPITEKIPKLLVEVAGKPFFAHQIELLRKQGLTHIVVCAGYLGEMIVDAFGDGRDWGVTIDYSFDGERLLGTGGAIVRALPKLGDAFYVLYGDSYLTIDFTSVGQRFLDSSAMGLMTVFENHEAFDSSNVWFKDGQIRKYSKRDKDPRMQHIDYGLGLFRSNAFASCSHDEFCDLSTIQTELVSNGSMLGYEVHERFFEIGSHSGLAELNQLLQSQDL